MILQVLFRILRIAGRAYHDCEGATEVGRTSQLNARVLTQIDFGSLYRQSKSRTYRLASMANKVLLSRDHHGGTVA